jgi:hypothetical protein
MILYAIQNGDTFEVTSEFEKPILTVKGKHCTNDSTYISYIDSDGLLKVIDYEGRLINIFKDEEDLIESTDAHGNLIRMPLGSKNNNKRNHIDKRTNLCIDVVAIYRDGYEPSDDDGSSLNKLGFYNPNFSSEKSLKDVFEYVLIFVVTLFFLYLFVF